MFNVGDLVMFEGAAIKITYGIVTEKVRQHSFAYYVVQWFDPLVAEQKSYPARQLRLVTEVK